MQVKLINEALKRVQLPALSHSKLEAFKAGVRALAYELEKDTTPEDAVSVTLDTTPETAEYLQGLIDEQPALSIVPTESLITFTDEIAANIRKVFDNENSFIERFFIDGIAVDEFYMASERCRVVFQVREGKRAQYDWGANHTTIKTADFLAWAEGLNDDQR